MKLNNKPYLIKFPEIGASELGYISIAEKENLPFTPKRIYWTYYTPQNVVRGKHAHINLEQVLVALAGKIEIEIEDVNSEKYHFILDSPNIGLYMPKLTWRDMKYTHDAVQMCIASIEYNEKDYIRDYNEFLTYRDEL